MIDWDLEPSPQEFEEVKARRRRAEAKKANAFKAIEERRGISPRDWTPLAQQLALEYEPEFAFLRTRPPGAPEVWHHGRLILLWTDIHVLLESKKAGSVSHACNILTKREDWRSHSPEGLRQAYFRRALKSPYVAIVRYLVENGEAAIRQGVHYRENAWAIVRHIDALKKKVVS